MATTEDNAFRPSISDGKSMRLIWRPDDGNGDPDSGLFERTRFAYTGHPTWKIYCGDAPEKVNGVLIAPPKSCYLDDRSAYKILHWDGFTKAERGRYWRHDFGSKGELRPHRKQRGRPAFVQDGETAYLQGPSKKYRFSGADDPREIELINREQAAQRAGQILVIMDPITASVAASPAKKADPRTAGIFQSITLSPASSLHSGSDQNQQKRASSPLTAELENPDAPKKPRYGNADKAADSYSGLKNTISALQDRNKNTSERLLELQKENKHLTAQLTSTQTLWAATSSELFQLRLSNRTMRATLHEHAKGTSAEVLSIVLKEEKTVYRELAKHIYAKFKAAIVTLQDGAIAVDAFQDLRQTLNDAEEAVIPVKVAHDIVKGDLQEIQQTILQVLGADWESFEKEIEAATAIREESQEL